MIRIEIKEITDIREAVIEMYNDCPHYLSDEDIITEMEIAIDEIKEGRQKK